MSGVDVETILKQVEALLARAGDLPGEAQQAVEKLLNVVEALSGDKERTRRRGAETVHVSSIRKRKPRRPRRESRMTNRLSPRQQSFLREATTQTG